MSLASGRMVVEALIQQGYDVGALTIGRDGAWALSAGAALPASDPHPQDDLPMTATPRETLAGLQNLADADVVFLALHGRFGEDGTLQGMLETVGLPYTGSGPLASALSMHKEKAKELLYLHGLQVPHGMVVRTEDIRNALESTVAEILDRIGLPVVVKPNQGGSSLGAGVAENAAELGAVLQDAARHDADVLVEERLVGTEVTCAVVERLDGTPEAFPLIEIIPHRNTFFDFQSKYESGGADEIVPARVSAEDARLCQEAAVRAHEALGCEGFSRTDIFLTERGPVLLEVNTIPGMTPNSLLPKAAAAHGIPFPALMDRLVQLAVRRHERHRRL